MSNNENVNYPVGVCNEMCPEEEVERRKKEKLVHILELPSATKLDNSKVHKNVMVKEFIRSAAGQSFQTIYQLRTVNGLLKTVHYLLNIIIMRSDVQWNVIYEFIMDRLRSVRQDIIIQNMSKMCCLCLLQPIIKFYVYASYRLCEEPITIFDATINNTHLNECLKRLLCIYDELDLIVTKANQAENTFSYNSISLYSECRPFMEALYLILNLGSTTAMVRASELPAPWKNQLVNKCLNLSLHYWKGNYVRVCREIKTLPPLLIASASLHLPRLRKRAFVVMSNAYNSNNLTFPANHLQEILLYDNIESLLHDCAYYGLSTVNNNIIFTKSSFLVNKAELPKKHLSIVEELLSKYHLPDLLLTDNHYKL